MTNRPNKKTTTTQSSWLRSKGVEWIFLNLPYVCFLAVLGVVYIFNAHATERKLVKIKTLQSELNDLKWEYMDVKREIMYGGTQSQIQKRVADLGLKPVEKTPVKIRQNGAQKGD